MRRLGKRFYSAVNSAAESTKKQPKNQLQVDDFKNITTQQYVGSRPFPMNPFFQPKPPIANSTKKEIYSLYLEDPSKWTPRALAEKYGISIVRTEAILRLKSLENSFIEKNIPVQMELVKGMEKLLKPTTINAQERYLTYEPIREHVVDGMHPFGYLLEEEERFTPMDASELLSKEPFKNIERRLDIKAQKVFSDSVVEVGEELIKVDEDIKGKNDFLIVNTSKESPKEEFYVREQGGKLRKASKPEIWKAKSNTPRKYTM